MRVIDTFKGLGKRKEVIPCLIDSYCVTFCVWFKLFITYIICFVLRVKCAVLASNEAQNSNYRFSKAAKHPRLPGQYVWQDGKDPIGQNSNGHNEEGKHYLALTGWKKYKGHRHDDNLTDL